MTTQKTTPASTIVTKSINLIDGQFTPSQAADILHAMLDVKINYHKIQRISRTEGNASDKCTFDNGRLDELLLEKANLKRIIAEARQNGKQLVIEGPISLKMID